MERNRTVRRKSWRQLKGSEGILKEGKLVIQGEQPLAVQLFKSRRGPRRSLKAWGYAVGNFSPGTMIPFLGVGGFRPYQTGWNMGRGYSGFFLPYSSNPAWYTSVAVRKPSSVNPVNCASANHQVPASRLATVTVPMQGRAIRQNIMMLMPCRGV